MKSFNSQTKVLILLVLFLAIFYVLIPKISNSASSSNGLSKAQSGSSSPSSGSSSGKASSSSDSSVGGGGQFFGGRIGSMVECTCSSGYQVTITGGRASGTYLYDSAKSYSKHNVTSGKQVIGGYSGGGECMIGEEPYCESLPISKGTISFIATS